MKQKNLLPGEQIISFQSCGAPLAQWVKHLPVDLAVQSSRPARGGIFSTANVSDAEASFLDLHLSISDGFVKTKTYDKRDDFDFDIVNFPFLDGDVPRSASYGVYISQLIRFARVSSHVDDFNTRNKVLTAKLLRQG